MRNSAASIFLGLLCACEPEPPPPPAPVAPPRTVPAPTSPTDSPRDAGPAAEPIEYAGNPVGIAAIEVLREGPGWRFERQSWRVGETEGTAWRARFDADAKFDVNASPDVVAFSELLPDDEGPWVTINGGFYEAHDEGFRPMGLVVSGGHESSPWTKRGGSGIFYVDADGPAIVHRDEYRKRSPKALVALQSIDRVLDERRSLVTAKPDADAASRSGVAVGEEAVWFVAVAANDDIVETPHGVRLRRSDRGMPLWAFAHYLHVTTDATTALNLDGGVSTQLAARDGEWSFVVEGARGTINALVARPLSGSR